MQKTRGTFLLIEDDILLGESLKEYLEIQGFSVKWIKEKFGDIENTVDFSCFHGIILDLILPERSGEEILRIIRSKTASVPVLVLTAKRELDAKRTCFLDGADDYLVKPFEMEELLLRLNALMRRREGKGCYILGGCIVDEHTGIISKEGKEVRISNRAWNLLIYLIKNRGRVVDKEELLSNVWQDVHVTEETLRAHVKELRKLFPHSIETYKGRGYRLV